MTCVLDTSACLIPSTFSSNCKKYKTTLSVIYELDKLKMEPRTSRKQRLQLKTLFQLFESGKLEIDTEYTDPPADDHLIQITTAKDELYAQDFQLYFKQKTMKKKQKLVNAELPPHLENPTPLVKTDKVLDGKYIDIELQLPNNTYVFVSNELSSRIGRYVNKRIEFIQNTKLTGNIQNITPQCQEQKMFVDQILQPDIQLVMQFGAAGSGKTMLQLAQALHLVQKGQYETIVVSQPPVQLGGRDRYGYFPGSIEEKASIYISGVQCNLEFLCGEYGKTMFKEQQQGKSNVLRIQSFANVRGSSIKKALIIIDEAQNTSQHELKTLITRADKDSKIILIGDIEQVDTSHKDIESNGFIYVQDRMYFSDVQTVLKLPKVYRSYLADEQSRIL